MEQQSRKIVDYIQELSNKIIDHYKDEEYHIEVAFTGSIQLKTIRFNASYTLKDLEQILPIVFERGALRAGKKLNLMIQQFEKA